MLGTSGSSKISAKEKIIFLDAGTVDYGDVSLAEIEKLGRLKTYFKTSAADMARRVEGVRHVITNKCCFPAELLASLKSVRGIHLAATGFNNIDLRAARRAGIAVTNVSGYCTEIMAQFTFGFLLTLACNLDKYNRAVHAGRWSRSPFFMAADFPIREIHGQTLGVIGYGAIGKRVAEIARAFGMKVLVAKIPGRRYAAGAGRLPFEKVLRASDFLTIHAPLSELTRSLINAKVIRMMKKGSCLINTARGGIVDEKALRLALESGHLAGAACDVLTVEPPPRHHILMKARNLLMTPHAAWASLEARTRLIHEIALNIRAFQKGVRRNRIV